MDKEMKIAVLIDAENISSKYAQIILQEASSLGTIIYKRIYGNWTTSLLNSWKNELLNNAIQPIQQYSNTIGKNSSDSALIIDAMDLLYQKRLDAFCIVSSDSDFTRLATRLQESEIYVVGMGEQKTPRAFISACSKFVYLDLLYKSNKKNANLAPKKRKSDNNKSKDSSTSSAKKASRTNTPEESHSYKAGTNALPPAESTEPSRASETSERFSSSTSSVSSTSSSSPESVENNERFSSPDSFEDGYRSSSSESSDANYQAAPLDTIDDTLHGNGSDILMVEAALRDIAEEYSSDDGWILSARLGGYLSKRLPDFDTRNFGFRKFVPFVDSLNMFEHRSVASTEDPSVKQVSFRLIEE